MPHRREVYEAVGSLWDCFAVASLRDWRRPIVAATLDRYRAGESIGSLAHDYGLSRRRIKIVVETVRRKK